MQENSTDRKAFKLTSRGPDIKSELNKSSNNAKDMNIRIVDELNEEGSKNQYSSMKFINAKDFETEKERINKLESEVSWLLKQI